MSTKPNAKRKPQPPLSPADALSILRSAVGYVMQAGLSVHAGTVDGALVIKVADAAADIGDGMVRFVPALHTDVPALDDVPAPDS